MTTKNQIYRCPICGNIIEVIHAGGGELVCCGQPMELLQSKTEDTGFEKHLPVIEKSENKITVKIGSIPHPMEEAHYIEWVECVDCGCRKILKPGDLPEAEFNCCGEKCECGGNVRAYCNLHGLWKNS